MLLVRSGLGLMRRTCSSVGLPASLVCSLLLRGELKGRLEPSADRDTLRFLLRHKEGRGGKTLERMLGGYKPLVWSSESEGGGTETEAQTVILRSEMIGEQTTTITTTVLGAHKVTPDQLREVFCLAQSFLRLVERSQQGRVVTQESL